MSIRLFIDSNRRIIIIDLLSTKDRLFGEHDHKCYSHSDNKFKGKKMTQPIIFGLLQLSSRFDLSFSAQHWPGFMGSCWNIDLDKLTVENDHTFFYYYSQSAPDYMKKVLEVTTKGNYQNR